MALISAIAYDAFWAALAALGFALLFTVPKKMLIYCTVVAAVVHSFRALLIESGISIELGTFLAAALTGFVGHFIAQRMWVPEQAITVPAIIPMIPGSFAFKAMIALVELNAHPGLPEQLVEQAVSNGLRAAFILGALSLGLALPGALVFRRKPVV